MIDLATWNLTIPVGVPAVTIDTPLLVGGYQDHYFQSNSGAIFFWAPVNGTTTPNSSYPRSELRETFADGSRRNWVYPSADHYLSATLQVTQVPSTGKLVIGQIHTATTNWPLFKLEYQMQSSGTGNLSFKVRHKPTDPEAQSYVLVRGVALNQKINYTVHLSPSGSLTVSLNGVKWGTKLDSAWAVQPVYFKAGVYTQDNSGYETEAGAATFTKLKIEHRPLASPTAAQ
ncbi:polysaccharide lyase family 7 protein [Pseudomonas sp. 2FG]|uniref:polysaccharide lyase family 7 protein n=1 Tax=Pseudomonas sp. 2FG TaxID=2502191 RepID=UPI0010F4AAD1|nr:polysaccharide lyase family 7 protein [Pseudomonas sp. 2FG]